MQEILQTFNRVPDRIPYEYVGEDIEDTTIHDFRQPGAWLPRSEIFRRNQMRPSIIDELETYQNNFNAARVSANNVQNQPNHNRIHHDVAGMIDLLMEEETDGSESHFLTARSAPSISRRPGSFNQNRTNQNYNRGNGRNRNNNRGRGNPNFYYQGGSGNTWQRPQYDERGRSSGSDRNYRPNTNPNRNRYRDDFINSNYDSSSQNSRGYYHRR